MFNRARLAVCFSLVALASTFGAAATPLAMTMAVDASQAPQKLLHVRVEIPVAPGPLMLLYPKWIPGEHGPSGPLANLVGLHLQAGGQEVAWQRDGLDLFAHHAVVPAGATTLSARADFLYLNEGGSFSSGPGATDALAVVNWNAVALYPQGSSGEEITVTPSLKLPPGWSFATALKVRAREGEVVHFEPVSLTALVDSPVLIGRYLVDLDLGVQAGAPHVLSIAADRAADLAGNENLVAPMKRLVAETLAFFGARHYDSYRWLLTLSDHVQHFGLEHHQSSDNRREAETLVKPELLPSLAGLLSHEFVHSWNGKYRRPVGLLSPDFQHPMQGELLWVYEGLTSHLGNLLPTRAGFWTEELYREELALSAASLDAQAGRQWRPLGDTATAAQMLFVAPGEGRERRRAADFYAESNFLWLDVDTLLREHSGGKVTLDTFCQRFHGGSNSGAALEPYTREDLIATLNALTPYDWQSFLSGWVDRLNPRLPMAGVERAGWKLVFDETPNAAQKSSEARREGRDWRFSLGFAVDKEGKVNEVIPGSPAAEAGLVAGSKLLGVGGYVYAPRSVDGAITGAKGGSDPIEIIASFGDAIRTHRVHYHGGPRYPHLVRIAGKPDVLAEILRPHA